MNFNPFATKDDSGQSTKQAENKDQDLSTLLSQDERGDLTILVSDITQKMQKRVSDIFDTSNDFGSFKAAKPKSLEYQSGDVKVKEENDTDQKEETPEEKKARKIQEKREKELSAPEMLELKNESLKYFQEWQESVIGRIAEAVNTRHAAEEAKEQVHVEEARTDAEPKEQELEQKVDFEDIVASQGQLTLEDPDEALINLYPPTGTPLVSLKKDKRVLLLHSMLLMLLSLEHYSSYSRILLLNLASSLHLPLHILTEDEVKVAQTLAKAAKQMSAEEETQKRSESNQSSRRWKVGLAGVAGAAIIGITGGLAAPLVAAGIGTVMGGLGLGATAAAGLLGTLAESGVIVGALFGAYGGRMTSKMMDQYAKEVEDFAFLPLHSHKKAASSWYSSNTTTDTKNKDTSSSDTAPEDRRLRITIGISGWLTSKEDTITPWRILSSSPSLSSSEIFALRWELAALLKLGTSIESVIKSTAWSMAKKELISRTIFASLVSALWPLSFLQIGKVVDNPFSVAKARADKAGLVLADALINRAQGERPVTLVGYSLGARVIYSCLMSLAERRAFGLVENAVLIGAPCPSNVTVWRAMRSVVAGRLVNVYSERDLVLAFLYRTSSVQLGVAGLQKVGADIDWVKASGTQKLGEWIGGTSKTDQSPESKPKPKEELKTKEKETEEPDPAAGLHIENVDVSSIVSGHMRYQYLVGVILEKIGWEGLDRVEVAREAETVALLEEEEERQKRDADAESEKK